MDHEHKQMAGVGHGKFHPLVRIFKFLALAVGVVYFAICFIGSAKVSSVLCALLCLYWFASGIIKGCKSNELK